MLEGGVGPRVLRLVECWDPPVGSRTRSGLSDDLGEYLDDHLNHREKAMYGRVRSFRIRDSPDGSGADVSVDGAVGIVLEQAVAEDDVDRLRRRILDSRENYALVIVCGCGFEGTDDWNALKRRFGVSGSAAGSPVRFVEKFDDSRTFRGGGGGGSSGGGGSLDLGIRRT